MIVWLYWMIPVIFEIGLISITIHFGHVFKA